MPVGKRKNGRDGARLRFHGGIFGKFDLLELVRWVGQ